MLVFTRQRDETIVIGEGIEITIIDIRGEKVRIGINAPAHVPVHRKEVYEAMKREKQQAGKPDDPIRSLAKGIVLKPADDSSGVTRAESQALLGEQDPRGKKAC